MTRPLRSVKPDEKPPTRKRKAPVRTVSEAATNGSAKDLVIAMRSRVAAAVDDPNCPPRDLAALTRRLSELRKDLEAIEAAEAEEAGGAAKTPDDEWEAI